MHVQKLALKTVRLLNAVVRADLEGIEQDINACRDDSTLHEMFAIRNWLH